jgi:hypothetical protein
MKKWKGKDKPKWKKKWFGSKNNKACSIAKGTWPPAGMDKRIATQQKVNQGFTVSTKQSAM